MSNKLNLARERLAQSRLVGFQSNTPAKSASAKLSVPKAGSPKLGATKTGSPKLGGDVVKTGSPKLGNGGVVKTGSPKVGEVVKTL